MHDSPNRKQRFINQTADATRLCNYTKFQIMPMHSKENVYFFFFWLYLPQRKQKETRKRAGGEGSPVFL
jgi:hypothetical protein